MKIEWSPDSYLAFQGPRLRAAFDLLVRIPGPPGRPAPRHIVDLGCGAGGPTRLLARRWPEARILGIDRSEAMLDSARDAGGDVEWRHADVGSWRPDEAAEPPDLIFSNACLHWIGDHDSLFPRLVSYLPAAGILAVQMPLSWLQPSHSLMREVLVELGLRDRAPALFRRPVDEPDVYVRRLRSHVASLDVWTTTYQQILEGDEPVYRFVQSTGLRPVRAALHGADWDRFDTEYRSRLAKAYPRESDGSTIFPFRRLFLVAAKP